MKVNHSEMKAVANGSWNDAQIKVLKRVSALEHARACKRGRGLQKAILQPFQGGRYLQKAPRSRCVAISGGYGPSISTAFGPRCPRGPRRLPGTVLQPFQAGRSAEKATRSGFTAIPRGEGSPEGSQERFYNLSRGVRGAQKAPRSGFTGIPGGGGPQKVPRSGFATILYSHSRGHSRRVGAPRRLPGHPEGSQERFCSHSKVVGAPEGPWRRDGGGGFALLTTPYEGFVPFNQPLQGFWACRWPAPRRSGFNQPLREAEPSFNLVKK